MAGIIYKSPRERLVHRVISKRGDAGATVFEVRKVIGLQVLPGTVNNCVRNLSKRGLVDCVGCTTEGDRIGRGYGEADVYKARVVANG
jgi:5-formyltetrahydrofolate cyclo-ligase